MKINYLVCYDISDDFRLQRVSRFLKGKGIHLQYSVFYCCLNPEEVIGIKNELKDLINREKDDVRFYPVTLKFKPIILGKRGLIPEEVEIILSPI